MLLLGTGALLGGDWLGEGLDDPLGRLLQLSALTFGSAVVAALLVGLGWRKRLVTGVFVGALACLGFWAGDRIAGLAFNSCVERGEEVRLALAEYKSRAGHYPASLGDLEAAIPGGRLLRRNILVYKPRAGGYALTFSDWLVTHSATESSGWFASK
jgi:hypothetical protein